MIVRDRETRDRAAKMVLAIRAEHCPVEVLVRPYQETRTTQQNARHWAMLTDLAIYMASVMGGVYHVPEIWHAYFCSKFIGTEEHEMPDGSVITRHKSSTKEGKRDFSDLDAKIEAEMAAEYGWSWDEQKRDTA